MQSAPPPLPQPSQLPPLADQSSLEAPPYAPAYGGHSEWPLPTLSLRISDLAHPGVAIFFGSVDPPEALKRAVMASFVWLYGSPEASPAHVRSIELILRPMDGVAYCTGCSPDPKSHKEIHFSLRHIVNSKARAKEEIMGVLTHEVVHCFQHNSGGTAPGGLIEGFADYVRLREHLAPPHWSPVPGDDATWDSGYERTGFFLNWLESRYGEGTVRELNYWMDDKNGKWDEGVFKTVTGRKITKLWSKYKQDGGGQYPDAKLVAETPDEDEEEAVLISKEDI